MLAHKFIYIQPRRERRVRFVDGHRADLQSIKKRRNMTKFAHIYTKWWLLLVFYFAFSLSTSQPNTANDPKIKYDKIPQLPQKSTHKHNAREKEIFNNNFMCFQKRLQDAYTVICAYGHWQLPAVSIFMALTTKIVYSSFPSHSSHRVKLLSDNENIRLLLSVIDNNQLAT